MGKLKRNRRQRPAPSGAPSGTPAGNPQDESARRNKVLPLMARLQSAEPNERLMAIQAILVLCDDERMRTLLLKERLVQVVMEQSLNDNNDEIVVEAVGLLRNLVLDEGRLLAVHLWRQHVWVQISAGLDRVRTLVAALREGKGGNDKSKTQLLFDYADNLVALVVGLAVADDLVFAEVCGKIDTVLAVVSDIVGWCVASQLLMVTSKLFNTLLDLVYSFCNQLKEFVEHIHSHPPFQVHDVAALVEHAHMNKLAQVYVLGIQFHEAESGYVPSGAEAMAAKQQQCGQLLLQALQLISRVDVPGCEQLIQRSLSKTIDASSNNEQDTKALNGAKSDLQSVEVAAELVAGVMEFVLMNDMDILEPTPVVDSLVEAVQGAVAPALTALLAHPDFQLRALVALNNVCWFFLSIDRPVESAWVQQCGGVWTTLTSTVVSPALWTAQSSPGQLAVCIDAIGVLTAIARTLAQSDLSVLVSDEYASWLVQTAQQAPQQGDITPEQLEIHQQLVERVVGFVASLATQLAAVDTRVQALQTLTDFLVLWPALLPVADAAVVVEALNGVFSVFGQDDTPAADHIFASQNYAAALKQSQNAVREMYKKVDKNKDPELKARAEEVFTNLGRFIAYKGA